MPRRIRAIAPAKVNLHLGVGGLLDSGYHRLDAVFHALELSDELVLSEAERLALVCDRDLGVPAERNLAFGAALAFGRAVGREPAVAIHLTKRIPHGAGLGGGSSDAAAVIAGLALLWGIELSEPVCMRTAASIGADVPFFLQDGPRLMAGRGDEPVEELPALDAAIVLIKPEGSISTAQAYRAFDAAPVAAPDPSPVVRALRAGDPRALGGALANNFVSVAVALVPECGHALEWLRARDGVHGATVAGSGSAVFGVVESDEKAHHIAQEAEGRGWWSTATRLRACGISVYEEEGSA